MQNILIVSEEKNHLMLSIKEHLKNASYTGIVVSAEMEAINEITDPLCGIVIHADWDTIKQRKALTALKNRAIKEGIPVFSIGKADGLKVLKLIISDRLVCHEFLRPITVHVSILANKIDSLIKQYNRQKKILVVDDSGAMLRVVKGWLGDKYSLSTANSGAMAIKYLALNRPDLILLDYEMPVVDGKQVLEMIRTEPEFADIPVIFLTKKDDAESIMNVQKLKPDGYLLKTMESDMIKKAVDDFFEKKKEDM
ncbi:MAG: response regulator [Spirochaetaceae bacterium]|jgi:CheY-like chemotaxis protein|nr:response regulator [Spirochaetaceae bacterium]